MKNGNLIRRCRCTDPKTKKEYGAPCPKLKSSRLHGTWSAVQELEPNQNGDRRRFRRGGFETSTKAQEELDKVRALMAIPEEDDAWGKTQISDLLENCVRDKDPVPDYDETRRRFKTGQTLNSKVTVAEWLDTWLAGRKRLRRGGATRYECDIRVHLKPHLGNLRLDMLRVHHIDSMFDAINERNIEVREQDAQRREPCARTSRPRRTRVPRTASDAIGCVPSSTRCLPSDGSPASTRSHISGTPCAPH